jgi:general secretion pathway protein G
MKTRGFTLIELLVVIAIISIIAAILFPVFASVRGKARQAVCLSNMRQIGMAISMYAQDSDDFYPNGTDPSDLYATPPIWAGSPYYAQVLATPLLNFDPHVPGQTGVLTPYIKNNEVWRCPSDSGYTVLDNVAFSNLNARPTSYEAFGTSYLFRTELAIKHKLYSSLVGYDPIPPFAEHGAAEVNVLMDGAGAWHGGTIFGQRRYDVLMGDGHVVNQDQDRYQRTWRMLLDPPIRPS